MTKKNQYYKLIEYVQKNNIAKVFNFRTNKVEEYLTVMTKKEKLQALISQEKLPQQQSFWRLQWPPGSAAAGPPTPSAK